MFSGENHDGDRKPSDRRSDPDRTGDDAGATGKPTFGVSRRRTLAGLAGLGALGSLSGLASADDGSDKRSRDPDGDFDITIDNGTAEVTVGELEFDSFLFNGTGTVFGGGYGLQEGDGDIEFSYYGDGTVVSTYPSTGTPGTAYTATVDHSLQDAGGGPLGDVRVDQTVVLDPTDALCTLEYCVTNSGSQSLSGLSLYQYMDYDISGSGGEFGEYVTSPFEYVYQFDSSEGIYVGFNGQTASRNHDVEEYSELEDRINRYNDPDVSSPATTGPLFNDDRYPDSGTDDTTVALEWGLGGLAPGASTCFSVQFAAATTQAGLESLLSEPTGAVGEITVDGRTIGPPADCDGDGLFEDVNGDGTVDEQDFWDLTVIARAYARDPSVLTADQVAAFDFDGNGRFDGRDVRALARGIRLGTACSSGGGGDGGGDGGDGGGGVETAPSGGSDDGGDGGGRSRRGGR
jgi:hypothetical protein